MNGPMNGPTSSKRANVQPLVRAPLHLCPLEAHL